MSFPLNKTKSMRMSNYPRWHSNCIGRTFCLWHLISMTKIPVTNITNLCAIVCLVNYTPADVLILSSEMDSISSDLLIWLNLILRLSWHVYILLFSKSKRHRHSMIYFLARKLRTSTESLSESHSRQVLNHCPNPYIYQHQGHQ